MRYRPSRFSPLVAAAATAATASCGLIGQAFGAYTVTKIVTASSSAPFVGADDTGDGISITYTSASPSTPASGNFTDGAAYSTFVGTLNGYVTGFAGNSSYGATTPFAYDPVNGFRYIGVYVPTSNSGHSNV